jgi:hypothetical protein
MDRPQDELLDALAAVIGRSPILVRAPAARLPDRFDERDVAILDWIVAHVRAVPHNLPMM